MVLAASCSRGVDVHILLLDEKYAAVGGFSVGGYWSLCTGLGGKV